MKEGGQSVAKMSTERERTKAETDRLHADTYQLVTSAKDHAAHGQYYTDSGAGSINHGLACAGSMLTTGVALTSGPAGWGALYAEDGGKLLDQNPRLGGQILHGASAVGGPALRQPHWPCQPIETVWQAAARQY